MDEQSHTAKSVKFRKKVTPGQLIVSAEEPCLFPISVGARDKDVEDVASAYLWAKDRYNIKAILLGDGLYKITLRICRNLNLSESEKVAIAEGQELLERFSDKIDSREIPVYKTSDIQKTIEFKRCYEIIDALYEHDFEFRRAVDDNAHHFVERQRDHGCLRIDEFEAINLSIFYLIQEIAVYLYLSERGWLFEVYLGQEIPALVKIMTGKVPAAPDSLKRRVNIGLQKKVRQIQRAAPPTSVKVAKIRRSIPAQLATSVHHHANDDKVQEGVDRAAS
jgi:tRNA-dependent cyclodipeptide synthase